MMRIRPRWCRFLQRSAGLLFIDVHGDDAEALLDRVPPWRHNHVAYIHPASDFVVPINVLECDHPEDRARVDASPEETPRLARIVYVTAMLCARHRLTVVDLVELLSVGAADIRASLLRDFDNRIVKRELEDLSLLADRHPREFLSIVESCKNRFVRWLGDGGRLQRILSQKKGLNPRAIMDGRNIALVDLSSLTYSDAAFVGTLITSMYFAAARRRPPMQCARHRLILDEAESLITVDVARMTDQCAKYGLNLVAAIQRLGQLRAKGDFVCDALFTNCAVKICFGGLETESARYMTELLYSGFLDLQEWKDKSKRPVAVGQIKTTVRNSSRSEMYAEHETYAHTTSHSHGEATGTSSTTSVASGDFSGSADMSGVVMTPPASMFGPNAPNATAFSVPMSLSSGENSSQGSSEQSSSSTGETHVSIDSYAEAETHGHGASRGTSLTTGESECFVTEYQWLESTMYSLEEQLHRQTGEIMNLPRRYCVVKIEDQRPFKTRTADLTPSFHSPLFKDAALPLFLKLTSERSAYLLPMAEVDAQLAARKAMPAPTLEPDLTTPEPVPLVVDAPAKFAADFWHKRAKPLGDPPKPKSKSKTLRPGRKPVGELPPGADRFTVIDGGEDGDKSTTD